MSRALSVCIGAAVAAALGLAGCKDKPKPPPQPGQDKPPMTVPAPAPTPPVTPKPVVVPKPSPAVGVDRADDPSPQVQGIFPRTQSVDRWVKISAVTKFDGDKLAEMVGQANVDFYKPYNVDWAAQAQYRRGDDRSEAAVVRVFRCATAADAYGLASIGSDRLFGQTIGQQTREGKSQLHVWAGNFYLHLYSEALDLPSFKRAMAQLASDMAPRLGGDGSPPALVRMLPAKDQLPGAIHYFKGPDALTSRGVNFPNQESFCAAVAWEPTDEVVVAAYGTPRGRSACYMFLARFPTEERAAQVQRTLKGLVDKADTKLGAAMMVCERPVGCHVFGTLTAAEYGAMEAAATPATADELPILPTIQKRLTP